MNIKEKVLFLAKQLGYTQEAFVAEMGMTMGGFRGVHKERSLNSDAISALKRNHPEVSLDWLIMDGDSEDWNVSNNSLSFENEVEMVRYIYSNSEKFKNLKSFSEMISNHQEDMKYKSLEDRFSELEKKIEGYLFTK